MDFKPLITITINNNYATDRACQQSLDQRELESSPISRREGIRPGRHILHVDVRFRVVGDTQALAWGDTRGAQDLSLSLIRARSLREQKKRKPNPPDTRNVCQRCRCISVSADAMRSTHAEMII
jgi:hypothetical protein